VVLLAIYVLTPVFFYVPTSSLAAVIIHAVSDLVVPPSTVRMFWRVAPTDVFIFFIGMIVIIFSSIEHGIFAMIGMSAALLLYRMFKAHGHFLGTVSISGVSTGLGNGSMQGRVTADPTLKTHRDSSRTLFVPLNRYDGSNPNVRIDRPRAGIFIYRFAQDFNYTNANHYIDHMVGVITKETRPVTMKSATRPGVCPSL
jgi:sodium-independent sulfate anion transporter 11